mmetsp:Transcript_32089/g.84007  ORF Transcript_32089/g.84007 Transcript_32089/m.84007 type:complete len:806 (-) Transcript_32089:83-2500(-)
MAAREHLLGQRLSLEGYGTRSLMSRRVGAAEAAARAQKAEETVGLRDASVDLPDARGMQDGCRELVEDGLGLFDAEERVGRADVLRRTRGDEQAEQKVCRDRGLVHGHLAQREELAPPALVGGELGAARGARGRELQPWLDAVPVRAMACGARHCHHLLVGRHLRQADGARALAAAAVAAACWRPQALDVGHSDRHRVGAMDELWQHPAHVRRVPLALHLELADELAQRRLGGGPRCTPAGGVDDDAVGIEQEGETADGRRVDLVGEFPRIGGEPGLHVLGHLRVRIRMGRDVEAKGRAHERLADRRARQLRAPARRGLLERRAAEGTQALGRAGGHRANLPAQARVVAHGGRREAVDHSRERYAAPSLRPAPEPRRRRAAQRADVHLGNEPFELALACVQPALWQMAVARMHDRDDVARATGHARHVARCVWHEVDADAAAAERRRRAVRRGELAPIGGIGEFVGALLLRLRRERLEPLIARLRQAATAAAAATTTVAVTALLTRIPRRNLGAPLRGRFAAAITPAVVAVVAVTPAVVVAAIVTAAVILTVVATTVIAAAIVVAVAAATAAVVAAAVVIPISAAAAAAATAAVVTATVVVAVGVAAHQPALQPRRDLFEMHEVAVPSAVADGLLVLAAARVLEVGDGAELSEDRPSAVEAPHQRLERSLCILLLAKLCVDVASQVVGEVLADAELLELATDISELLKYVLVELLEVVLQHLLVLLHHLARLRIVHLWRRHVHVLEQDRLAEDGAVVDARAAIAVAAGTHLQVEGAVDLVLLSAKDLCEMLRHPGGALVVRRWRA